MYFNITFNYCSLHNSLNIHN